ncbi:MAG TPA: bifunctional diguanylate cyclase/phosphodiesterase [Devosia sp.]
MSLQPKSLSRQILLLSFVFGTVLVTAVGSFGWWAASSIDDRAMARQSRAVQRGLSEIMERIPIEQDSSLVWDDSVLALRSGDEPWIAENLGEWMSEYFKHDLVYILDPNDLPIRAVEAGKLADPASFYTIAAPVQGLVAEQREQMKQASRELADSTAAVTGLGVEDVAVLGNGVVAVVSVRAVLPGTEAVSQAPGTEYLHISMRIIGDEMASEIAQKYELPGLSFQRAVVTDSERIASPVLNSRGRILGFFTWEPEEPAAELILGTLPVTVLCLSIAGIGVFFLLRRLQRTSSQLEQTEAQASFLAFHDPLTQLPNRALFEDRLEQALAKMRNGSSKIALHYIDLDHFKRVNDSLGHAAGDELLRQMSNRLLGLATSVDTVARLGGDEFAFVQFDVVDDASALTLSQRVVDTLSQPFDLLGHEVNVGASVGVTVVSDPSISAEDVIRQADVALYQAKGNGRSRFHSYDGDLNAAIKQRRKLEIELRGALTGEAGLELFYQPIYDAATGRIAGAEALVRWNHAQHGRLSPATFIGLAEERGLIDQLGLWVIENACAYAKSSDVPWVAVNASPLQFRDERFADRVLRILQATGLPPQRLEIEITEGLLLQNSALTQSTLTRLRAAGVRVALDDFGTGYSSISYLRSHGIDKLKIDQSYTAQLGRGSNIDKIVQSIVDLARAMNMAVTAEGVETEEQRAMLKAMGCDQLQGFLMSRPVDGDRLRGLMVDDAETESRHRA